MAAAIETIYPRATNDVGCTRCATCATAWQRDQARIKRDAQRNNLPRDVAQARRAFARLRFHRQSTYPSPIRRLEPDLPELLTFFDFPQPLWRKLRANAQRL